MSDCHSIPLFINELPVLRLTSVRCAINFCSEGPQTIVLSKLQHVQTNKIKSFDSFSYYFIKTMETPSVLFLGGCFRDLVACSERFPKVGETIVGTKFHMGFGGKAANAAVMCSRLGTVHVLILLTNRFINSVRLR